MKTFAPSPFFLHPNEVVELTGYKLTARQIEWLSNKGWRFELNAARRPIIARTYAEKMLGCGPAHEATIRPNFAALRTA